MKEIKYYHLRRNLTDEKPLDFVSLDNAYDFLVGFFTDKKAKVWHCDGIEDSTEPTPKEWVKAVMEEIGQIEFEIVTGDDEHYDLWLSEKELRLADDGIAGAFAPKATPIIKLHKTGERVLILLNGKAVCETSFTDWQKQNVSVIGELQKIIERMPAEQGELILEQGIAMTFDNPLLASEIEKALAIKTYRVELGKNTPDDEYYEWYDWDDNSDELIGEEQKSDIEFDFMRGLTEDEMIKNVIANQSPCVEFDETGKYYRYKDNFNRENQQTFNTISEAYDCLCQDAAGALVFYCDGYGKTQEPPPLDWLKKVINSCGKVEVEIGFPDGAKDIWIYQKER